MGKQELKSISYIEFQDIRLVFCINYKKKFVVNGISGFGHGGGSGDGRRRGRVLR